MQLILCALVGWSAATGAAANHANPIRKVVTMLQDMTAKVEAEGKKEEILYEKFMCYCKTNVGVLEQSIQTASDNIGSDTTELEATTEKKKTTQAALKEHVSSRNEGKAAMDKATGIRDKEAAEYAKFKEDSETNIAALGKALAAVSGGMGSFLQTRAANALRSYVMEKANVQDQTRHELLSFLSGTQDGGYAPASGEIVGILDQLKATMESDLKEATNTENAAVESYDKLIATKTHEVETLQAQIEKEMQAVGDLGIKLAEMKDDLEATAGSLVDDKKFLAELKTGCSTKTGEWEEVCKTRQQELTALADTVKILNDDDALELFKKTLPAPSASLVQIQVSAKNMRARALSALREARKSASARPELDLIELALNGKQMGFEKVVKMIDTMTQNLKNEQADDDDKKAYCEKNLDTTDDQKKVLEGSISDSSKAIDDLEGALEILTQEIQSLEAGISKLDKAVAEATEQRKEESADFEALISSDSAAKEILLFAKNRLNKFYNPKLYKPPAKKELSAEDRIVSNMGAAVLVQVSAHTARDVAAPPPPPETFGAYSKKSGEGGGVIAMIDLLVADMDKEMQIAKTDEKNAQEEYQSLTADAGDKRGQDSKTLTEKSTAKADAEEALEAEKLKKGDTGKELMGLMKEIYALHGECDWLLKFYDARTSARTGEIDAMAKAKAVLSGADYSLLQTSRQGFLASRQ